MGEPRTVEIVKRGRTFRVTDNDKNREFWELVQQGLWEETTFTIIDHFVTADVRYIDFGCWIGPTVLYAAQSAHSTYAFEPDPIAYEEMADNLAANKLTRWASRVHLANKAIAPHSSMITLGSRGAGGDSTSSVLFSDKKTKWTVEAISLPEFLASRNAIGGRTFIKIDIEGGEFELLPALKHYLRNEDVALFISVHTHFLAGIQKQANTFIGKVWCRLMLTYAHWRLCRALPFRFLYHSNGAPLSIRAALVDLFMTGSFPMEVVATNTKWQDGDSAHKQ